MTQTVDKKTSTVIQTSAAGKVILCGEYSVLYGWPALVFAMDRHFKVEIIRIDEYKKGVWVEVLGLSAESRLVPVDHAGNLNTPMDSPLAMFTQIFNGLLDFYNARAHFKNNSWRISLDSTALFDAGDKLGLGSSAALTVALDEAMSQLGKGEEQELNNQRWARLQRLHSNAQGKQGSGVDIAASLAGGFSRFVNHAYSDCELSQITPPKHVHFAFIWSGESASTPAYLNSLSNWKHLNPELFDEHMAALGEASETLTLACQQACDGPSFIQLLTLFTDKLRQFDQASKLGIFSANHLHLYEKAAGFNSLIYKPCGAGGGDLGLVASTDSEALQQFVSGIDCLGMRTINMNIDPIKD